MAHRGGRGGCIEGTRLRAHVSTGEMDCRWPKGGLARRGGRGGRVEDTYEWRERAGGGSAVGEMVELDAGARRQGWAEGELLRR